MIFVALLFGIASVWAFALATHGSILWLIAGILFAGLAGVCCAEWETNR